MAQTLLMDILILAKRVGDRLEEVQEISQQMGEAVDRNDTASIQMSLALRGEAIEKLKIADAALKESLQKEDSAGEIRRLSRLLAGEEKGSNPEEDMLCAQGEKNRRLGRRLLEYDKKISLRIAREESFYAEKKKPATED